VPMPSPACPSASEILRRVVRALVMEGQSQHVQSLTLTMRGSDGIDENASIELRSLVLPTTPAQQAAPSPGIQALTSLEQEICCTLKGGPLSGQEIADQLERSFTGTFRQTLSSLCKRDILSNDDGGYRIMQKPSNS
jgi:hypothetical protein